jgi:hypothetical protein
LFRPRQNRPCTVCCCVGRQTEPPRTIFIYWAELPFDLTKLWNSAFTIQITSSKTVERPWAKPRGPQGRCSPDNSASSSRSFFASLPTGRQELEQDSSSSYGTMTRWTSQKLSHIGNYTAAGMWQAPFFASQTSTAHHDTTTKSPSSTR